MKITCKFRLVFGLLWRQRWRITKSKQKQSKNSIQLLHMKVCDALLREVYVPTIFYSKPSLLLELQVGEDCEFNQLRFLAKV